MEILSEGIVIIVGNYGSGKTEVAINLAVHQKRRGIDVRVADLDLVNPYFRTREARKALAELGIEVVLPPEQYLHADLPILTPAIGGMIRKPSQLTVLDVGGDDAGARVLAALADALKDKPVRVIQVVNTYRPFTDTVDGCLRLRKEIENASKMTITGIIGNTHLLDDTTSADIYRGYEFVRQLSDETGMTLEFVTVAANLLTDIDTARFSCPVLPIERQLVPPWKKAVSLGMKKLAII
ncbi:MAG: cobalamin biosynthesis protein CbiA [Desulfobacteraceae bacterium IS3]|jgi:hypothetical protein|nr:MAG: cobalamin biosynthesis protein CbiA [Desulfobacteraceae bacterium IS3]HAO20207.1 cobalamin biosynthesis protein CbiA [Desulfobacteraceae bacterium]